MRNASSLVLLAPLLLGGCFIETGPGFPPCTTMRTVVLDGSRVGTKGRQETSAMATVVQPATCEQIGIVMRENAPGGRP